MSFPLKTIFYKLKLAIQKFNLKDEYQVLKCYINSEDSVLKNLYSFRTLSKHEILDFLIYVFQREETRELLLTKQLKIIDACLTVLDTINRTHGMELRNAFEKRNFVFTDTDPSNTLSILNEQNSPLNSLLRYVEKLHLSIDQPESKTTAAVLNHLIDNCYLPIPKRHSLSLKDFIRIVESLLSRPIYCEYISEFLEKQNQKKETLIILNDDQDTMTLNLNVDTETVSSDMFNNKHDILKVLHHIAIDVNVA